MLYRVRHITTYSYRQEVSAGRGLLHVLPASRVGQSVLSSRLSVEPAPAERRDGTDFFGNPVVAVRFAHPSRRQRFATDVMVRVDPAEPPHALLTPAWEEVAASALARPDLGPEAPAHFLHPSRFVPALAEASAAAAGMFTPGRPVLDAVQALMTGIHRDFAYDSGATDVSTPLATVARTRRGVCQDFAHWMVAVCRAVGVPARYVSGYLRTNPPPGRPRLVGADASHAWAQVWCGPALGWIGLDPTNDALQGEDHIQLALGRDYGDVSPVEGVVTTSAGHSLQVSVDVAPQDEGQPSRRKVSG